MKWRLAFLFFLGAGILTIVAFSSLLSYNACATPLPYAIGSIDARFGLTRANILSDIQQATTIWNTAEGKTLFVYSPSTVLRVNFVYDQRQALNSQIQQLNTNLGAANTTLQQKIDAFKAQEIAFEQKLAVFNAQVNTYNSQGGAPPDVYKSLIQQQNALNSEAQTLNVTARQLNLSTHEYNVGVSNLNQDINQFNTELTQKPEEGLYNPQDNTITIYLTNSTRELIHTLAHEFGHALGMAHVAGATSIMYPQTSNTLTPTSNDLKALAYVCRPQSLLIHEAMVFDEWMFTHIQNLQQTFVKG